MSVRKKRSATPLPSGARTNDGLDSARLDRDQPLGRELDRADLDRVRAPVELGLALVPERVARLDDARGAVVAPGRRLEVVLDDERPARESVPLDARRDEAVRRRESALVRLEGPLRDRALGEEDRDVGLEDARELVTVS